MEIKIYGWLKYMKFLSLFWIILSTILVVRSILRDSNPNYLNALIILFGFYSVSLLILMLHKYGMTAKLTDAELSETDGFIIIHKYPLSSIKKIYDFKHFYFGPVLNIDFIDKNNRPKTKILLLVQGFNPDDIKKLMRTLHEKRPDLELPKQWM